MRRLRELIVALALLAVGVFSCTVYAQTPKPVTFEWDCPDCALDEVEEFVFYESTVSANPATGNFQVVATIPVSQANYPTEIQLNTGRHWFYVTARNWAGESAPSNVVTINSQIPRTLILRKRTAG